jgi:phage tail-like protein
MPQQELITRYLFVLKIPDIDTIGYFCRCSGLKMSCDVLEYQEGGNNDFIHQLPGPIRYPRLILSRGLTNEEALLKWFFAARSQVQGKEITLTLQGPGSERVWTFADAFPVEWTGPELDSSANDPATETLEIAHTGLKLP